MTSNPLQWLTIVGIGEEGLKGLHPETLRAVNDAEVLVGGTRLLSKVKNSKAEKIGWGKNFDHGIDAISQHTGRRVVVLASGDPMHYGAGSKLVQRFGIEAMTIIPTPGAFSLAAARMGWSLPDVECITVHGRPIETVNLYLSPNAKLLILSWDGTTPTKLAALLIAKGYSESDITVLEQMNSETENRINNTAAKWETENCSALNTIAVECLAGPGAAIWSRAPGLPETAFQHDNMITKREVRAATLAALSPLPGETLWDIGAGSGAIAIEWLRLVPTARAIAVETNEDRVQSIRTNALNLGVPSLEIINGHAPRVFVGIDGSPDAIFVGGGVSNDALMHACWDRLATGGRLIANAVTLQAQQSLLNFHEKWGGETTKLSIARESRGGRFSGLRPLMEVWQLRVVKK